MKQEVDIFGTCLTRELFNTTEYFKVKTYLMQQSIFTMFSKPLSIDERSIKSHDNYGFKNRMLYYEMNKIGIHKMLEDPSPYLLVDLADVGRDILIFDIPSGVKLIKTQDVLYLLNILNAEAKYRYFTFDVRTYTDEEIRVKLQRFINALLTRYEKNKIILNRVQMQNIYYEHNEKKRIEDSFIYNRLSFIKRVEEIFMELLPECKVLYSKYEPVLDINHKLGGPHPAHFERIYYAYRMQLLNSIITGDVSIDEIDSNYKKIYNREIEQIRAKKLKR